jgi:ABC-type Fe3+ transport system permease subunit
LALTARLLGFDRQLSVQRSRLFQLGRWRLPATVALWLAIAVLAGIPIGSLLTKAGMIVTREGQQLARQWSASACAQMIADSPVRFSREFGWSLASALPAATGATGAAIALAWYARQGGWRAAPAWLAIAAALATPGTLVGLGLIALFNQPEWPWLIEAYDHSLVVVWIAQGFRALALPTLVLWYALRTIPAELLQSATLEGANAWSRLVRVALPERWPAVAAAWLVALAVAWGEMSATIVVQPPGVVTLPVQIFGLIHYGVDDRVAGISLVSMGGFFLLAIVLTAIVRRSAADTAAARPD